MSARSLKNGEAKEIRRLLRRIDSREYFQAGAWTLDPQQAQTFEDVVEAAEACARYGLMDVELALRFEQGAEDVFSVVIR
jgi:hypothetical protein